MRRTIACLALAACSPLPEPSYFRDGYDLATDFDHPVCEGTLRSFERRIQTVSGVAGRHPGDSLQVYWLTGDLTRVCPREGGGCFLPGTTMLAARQASVHHELVHAVLDNRWSEHFLEEGAAEVLGGEAVHFDPSAGRPFDALGIDSRDYRNGAVDYRAAAHFFHFLHAELGEPFVQTLVHAIDIGESPSAIVDLVENAFGRGADGIESGYRIGAPAYYPPRWRDDVWTLTPDDLIDPLFLSLDCDAPETMGPLDEEEGGMYIAARLELDDWLVGYLTLSGDEDLELAIFREADLAEGRFVQNWSRLDPSADPHALYTHPGEGLALALDPAERWILMLSTPSASKRARAQLWLSTPETN